MMHRGLRTATLVTVAVATALCGASTRALAQVAASLSPPPLGAGADFGPAIVIERIDIEGNSVTAERLIRRALPVKEGDALRAGDPRLAAARFKVLALGYFRDVELSLEKGARRGHVVLTVTVVERGTVVLNRMFFGTTAATPWWAGFDISERNLVGSGLGVGSAFVVAGAGEHEGAEDQRAFQLRLSDPSILGTPFGVHGSVHGIDASEPYRVRGSPSDVDSANFEAFSYSRAGGRGGVTVAATALSRLTADLRIERVNADLPLAPTRNLEDGSAVRVDLGLRPGVSRVVTVSFGFDRDTRADPVLPFNGHRILVHGEFGATWLGGDYNFGTALAKYQRWWALGSPTHVVSLHLTGGLVLGDAPLFDRLHVGDLNRMVSPRALGLVVSTTPSHDLLGTSTDDVTYGEVGSVVEGQYSYRLFRSRRHVYGGDLFIGVGLWGLATTRDLQVRDESLYRALPIDLLVDMGLRLDTEIGIFELSLANALGRVPL